MLSALRRNVVDSWREAWERERKRQRLGRIRVRTRWFRLIWLSVFALRAIMLCYLVGMSIGYSFMASPVLANTRNAYDLPAASELQTISGFLGAGAAVYALQLLQMVHFSLKQRRLAFRPRRTAQRTAPSSSASSHAPSSRPALQALTMYSAMLYDDIFGPRGLLGLEHPYFFQLLVLREVAEIGLQSYQTYSTTMLVPRRWISDLSAALLVLNCWSTLLVHAFGPTSLGAQRVLCLAVDVVLDFSWSVVVPLCIVGPYVLAYDPTIRAFPDALLGHHSWQLSWEMEIQHVCFTSWLDFLAAMLPWMSILSSSRSITGMIDEKRECRVHPTPSSSASSMPSGPVPVPVLTKREALKHIIGPGKTDAKRSFTTSLPRASNRHGTATSRNASSRNSSSATNANTAVSRRRRGWHRRLRRALNGYTLLFFTAGLAVIATHHYAIVIATKHSTSAGCLVQMRPWFTRTYACAYANINCYAGRVRSASSQHDNNATYDDGMEVTVRLATFEPQTLRYLVIAHATHLTVPPIIAQFSNLRKLEVFNATLAEWPAAAAITTATHPVLRRFSLVYTNVSSLPAAVSTDRVSFVFVHLIATNLTTLPARIATAWRTVKYLDMEHGQLTAIPPAAAALTGLERLSVCHNTITALPEALYGTYVALSVAQNPIDSLSVRLADVSRLREFLFERTLVSRLPAWLTAALAAQSSTSPSSSRSLVASGTGSPYCDAQQQQAQLSATTSSLSPRVECAVPNWRGSGYFRLALVSHYQPPASAVY